MQSKKGLSDVVTTVLIVLVAIIAIGIVAGIFLPMIRNSGTKMQQQQACLDVQFEVSNCLTGATTGNNVTVVVKRNPGAPSVGIAKEFKLIYTMADGSTVASSAYTPILNELESKVYHNNTLVVGPKKVAFALGIADDRGVVGYCNPIQPVSCS
jgi:hypothetical protein